MQLICVRNDIHVQVLFIHIHQMQVLQQIVESVGLLLTKIVSVFICIKKTVSKTGSLLREEANKNILNNFTE